MHNLKYVYNLYGASNLYANEKLFYCLLLRVFMINLIKAKTSCLSVQPSSCILGCTLSHMMYQCIKSLYHNLFDYLVYDTKYLRAVLSKQHIHSYGHTIC